MTSDPLASVVNALRDAARRDAARTVDVAGSQAERIVADARRQAEALLSRAIEEGRADATAVAAGHRSRGRRQARSLVLSARRRAFEQLVAQTREAVHAQLDTPGTTQALEALAHKVLGPDAVVHSDGAGVTAVSGTRRLRLSLDDFADRALNDLGLGP